MKQCSKCREWKDADEFHRATQRTDGLQPYCKECSKRATAKHAKTERAAMTRKEYRQTKKFKEYNKEQQRRYRKSNKNTEYRKKYNKSEHGKQSQRKYRETEKYKIRHRKESRKYKSSNPNKTKAHGAVAAAINSGAIPKASELVCHLCGNQAAHYHHHKGYKKENWLEVVPLCAKCHYAVHNT